MESWCGPALVGGVGDDEGGARSETRARDQRAFPPERGADVSTQVCERARAARLLRRTSRTLVGAGRKRSSGRPQLVGAGRKTRWIRRRRRSSSRSYSSTASSCSTSARRASFWARRRRASGSCSRPRARSPSAVPRKRRYGVAATPRFGSASGRAAGGRSGMHLDALREAVRTRCGSSGNASGRAAGPRRSQVSSSCLAVSGGQPGPAVVPTPAAPRRNHELRYRTYGYSRSGQPAAR